MRCFTTGAETGNFSDWNATSASTNYTAAVSSSAGRSGSYGIRLSRAASGFSGAGCYAEQVPDTNSTQVLQYAVESLGNFDAGNRNYGRFYIRFNTLPTAYGAGFWLMRIGPSGFATHASLSLASAGISASCTGGTATQILSTPSTATWYRIEWELIKFTTTTGIYNVHIYLGDAEIPLGGASLLWGTAGGAALTLGLFRLTMMPVVGALPGTGAMEWDYDDIGLNNGVGAANSSHLTPGAVTGFALTGDATPLDFTAAGGGTHYTEVDDAAPWPPDGDTTYIQTPVTTSAQEDNYDVTDYAGSNTVKAVLVTVYYRNEDHTLALGSSHHAGMVDSSGNRLENSGSLPLDNNSNYRYACVSISGTGSTGHTAWTNSEFNNAATEALFRREAVADSNMRLRCSGLFVQVEDDVAGYEDHRTRLRRPSGQVI